MDLSSTTVGSGIFVLGAALAALRIWIIKPILEIRDKQRQLYMDLYGLPARPEQGVPATPGAFQRIAKIEYELSPNSGKSLKDAVDRTETQVSGIANQQSKIENTVDAHLAESRQQRSDWDTWRRGVDDRLIEASAEREDARDAALHAVEAAESAASAIKDAVIHPTVAVHVTPPPQ